MQPYWHYWYDDKYMEVEGTKVKVLYMDCLVIKNPNEKALEYEKWICFELITGLIVSRGFSKERAIANANYLTERYGERYALEHILLGIADYGGSPDFDKNCPEIAAIKKRVNELQSFKIIDAKPVEQKDVKSDEVKKPKKEKKMTEETKVVEETVPAPVEKKKRGRPRKERVEPTEPIEKKKRGRPRKNV